MNLSKKTGKFIAAVALILGLLLTLVSNISYADIAPFDAKDFCKSGSTNCVKTDQTGRVGTISCPEGQVIDKVYVHAGDGQTVYQLPENGFSVAYSNNGRTATVTVTTFQHDLSWLGVTCTTATSTPTPTNTPTPTPTDTPTPTPTNTPTPTTTPIVCPEGQVYDNGQHICIVMECDGGGECEVVIGSPTPTVTPTATPTATPTPTSTPNNGGSSTVQSASGSSSSNNSTSGGSSTPAAPQMASTGNFGSLLSDISMLAGLVTSSIAAPMYAAKKKK